MNLPLPLHHHATRRPTRMDAGMTLVEIMIVLAIMASVMGVVGFFAFGALENSRVKQAQVQVGNLSQMVDSFYIIASEYPDNLNQLVNPPSGMAPLTKEIPKDPWKNDYRYNKGSSGQYELFSMGPDGRAGSEDDIYPAGGRKK